MVSDNQIKAVSELDHNLYVSASAGTGKTEILTRRYVNILEKKRASIHQILAITFTDKAASEMKFRIFNKLQKKIKSAKSSTIIKFWQKHKREFQYANISTIHSFCANLIREYSRILGTDPNFTILDENEFNFSIKDLLQKQSRNWLKIKGNNTNNFNFLLNHYKYSQIEELILKLFKHRQQLKDSLISYYNNVDDKIYTGKLFNFLQNERQKKINNFLKLDSSKIIFDNINLFNIEKDKNNSSPYSKYLFKLQEIFLELLKNKKISNYKIIYKNYSILDKSSKNLKKGDQKFWNTKQELLDHYNKINKLIAPFRVCLSKNLENISLDFYNKSLKISQIIIKLYKDLNSLIYTNKDDYPILYEWKKYSKLLYDDLQYLVLKLFHIKNFNKDNFLIKLKKKYLYVMLDECQDIDEYQRQIIEFFIHKDFNYTNIFLVGDEKQSIYYFRGANISEFANLKSNLLHEKGKIYALKVNYRSQKHLVNLTNQFFSYLMNESVEKYEVKYSEKIIAHRQNLEKCPVEMIFYQENNNEHNAFIEANSMAQKIISLKSEQNYSYGQIAILFQSMTYISYYENVFRSKGIPYQSTKSDNFYTYQEISDCLNLLEYLDQPDNLLLLSSLLRSPFCGITDTALYFLSFNKINLKAAIYNKKYHFNLNREDLKKLQHFVQLLNLLNNRKDRLKLHELVRLALEYSMYFFVILSCEEGDAKKFRLEKLIQIIFELEKNKFLSINELLIYIKNKINNIESVSTNLSSDKVQMMTVHKSKGMEFFIVMIAQCHRKLVYRTDLCLIHSKYGFGLKFYDYKVSDFISDPLFKYLKEEEEKKELAEFKRLFYVALTRARDYLILFSKVDFDDQDNIKTQKGQSRYLNSASWLDYFFDFFDQTNKILFKKNKNYQINFQGCQIQIKFYDFISKKENIIISKIKSFSKKKIYLKLMPLSSINSLPYLSATALTTYSQCPRKFYYQYFCKIKELQIFNESKKNSIENFSLIEKSCVKKYLKWPKNIPINLIGNLVHELLAQFQQISTDNLEFLILNYINKCLLLSLSDKDHCKEIGEQVKKLIQKFIESSLYKKIINTYQNNPEKNFQELTFNYKLKGINIQGSIDKLYYNHENNEYILLDYKSNRFYQSKNKLEQEIQEKTKMYHLQMELYYFVANKLLSSIKKVQLYYLYPNKNIQLDITHDNSSKEINLNLKKMLSNILKSLGKDNIQDDFNTFPSKQNCNFCTYWMCENRF